MYHSKDRKPQKWSGIEEVGPRSKKEGEKRGTTQYTKGWEISQRKCSKCIANNVSDVQTGHSRKGLKKKKKDIKT